MSVARYHAAAALTTPSPIPLRANALLVASAPDPIVLCNNDLDVDALESAVAAYLSGAPQQMTIPLATVVLVKRSGAA